MPVKRITPEFDGVFERIKDMDKIIKVSATKLMGDLIKAFSKSQNLSNRKNNKRLSEKYKIIKKGKSRKGTRDLNFSGDLYRSFSVVQEGKSHYSVGPRGESEQGKMEGNLTHDNKLMDVGKAYNKTLLDFIKDRILKGIK